MGLDQGGDDTLDFVRADECTAERPFHEDPDGEETIVLAELHDNISSCVTDKRRRVGDILWHHTE